MALAPLLYNITFDSQTRILYFWDKAGHEIYHCEIPSPIPPPPAPATAWLRADKTPGMYTGPWHDLFDDNGNYILLPGVTNDQLSVVNWYDENDNLVEFPESVSDRGKLITSLYSDSRLMFSAESWPYPYTAPSMLTRITYVINQ